MQLRERARKLMAEAKKGNISPSIDTGSLSSRSGSLSGTPDSNGDTRPCMPNKDVCDNDAVSLLSLNFISLLVLVRLWNWIACFTLNFLP